MIVAFCLPEKAPGEGLQAACLPIAQELRTRGHSCRLYAQAWPGERPEGFEIVEVPVQGFSGSQRDASYARAVAEHLAAHPADRVVGFRMMPGLDVYCAAGDCLVERNRGRLLIRLTSDYRHRAALERDIFRQGAPTQVLVFTERQARDFQTCYGTEPARLHRVPPGVPRRLHWRKISEGERAAVRVRNEIPEDALLILQVGSDFRRQGVELALKALSQIADPVRSRMLYCVAGTDKLASYKAMANALGIGSHVRFVQDMDAVPGLMAASDMLLHPAQDEATGFTLAESIVAGLPSVVSGACGYAECIRKAESGLVLEEPIDKMELRDAIVRVLGDSELRAQLAAGARRAADRFDYYSLPQKAADIIEGKK